MSYFPNKFIKIRVVEQTSNYTIVKKDFHKIFSCNGTFTITLPSAVTMEDGFHIFIKNNGNGNITIVSSVNTQKIDNDSSKILYPNESILVICNGVQYYTFHAGSFIIP